MPVLQTAIRDPRALELPAPADELDGIDRRPAGLLESIKGKRAGRSRPHVGQFLDVKVIWLLLELHTGKKSGAEKRGTPSRRPISLEFRQRLSTPSVRGG